MSLQFHKVTLEDKEWIQELMDKSNYPSSEFCFSNSFDWREIYDIKAARMGDYVILKSGKHHPTYLYPAGVGDIAPVIKALIEDAKENDVPFGMFGILEQNVQVLKDLFPDRFEYIYDRDHSDYIYTTESLSTLSGKKLHAKRNHIHKFEENNPDWSYEQLTPENLGEAWEMNAKWCEVNGCSKDESLKNEACAVRNAFDYFEPLGLQGGLLRAKGEVIAYSIGRPLNSNTFIVHIEKAFAEIQGAYPMMNQQFVLHNCQDFEFVNREDDTGAENLRKAKLSYYPYKILDKYYVRLK